MEIPTKLASKSGVLDQHCDIQGFRRRVLPIAADSQKVVAVICACASSSASDGKIISFIFHQKTFVSDTWNDSDEVIRLVESSPILHGSDDSLVQISDDTVVKFGHTFSSTSSEALAMNLVRAQTSIPVPRVRQVVRHMHPEGEGLIVMDLIRNGRQLHACWPSLSLWAKFKVVLTMRYYLRQLRQVQDEHSATPGPIGPEPSLCNGLQFGYDSQGPFPTTTALAEHFHKVLRFAQARGSQGYAASPGCDPLDESIFSPLVFTHNDLNMRNILLDDDGRLWIVDWGFSGFFPTWFEYLGMLFAAQKDRERRGWQMMVKFMTEPAFEVERWMAKIGYDYTQAP
ncbi:hypothetical protein EW146_g3538 [Bondarzewia mesenterica]|uniref:Aminoglycoside phosphotransferase domain-containing protein n=1 Tax=Bondarzewia mesenterica TaxID=1095465 RepID=A0A4S4LZH3_9AGAM|nr:hypothetical protein EW146_g3538 [Bondarzewia mesenterica]